MPIDARTFRHTVGQFVTGVTVIAIDVDGAVRGMTANAFTSVSLDPPARAVLRRSKTAHLAEGIRDATGFSVNILAHEQQALSTYLRRRVEENLLHRRSLHPWEGGPRLDGCAAALGCAVERSTRAAITGS